MSAERPEVGDVWNLGRDMYITEIYDGSSIFQNTLTVAVCLIKDNYGFALKNMTRNFYKNMGLISAKAKPALKIYFP